jgi:hypothetical protein
LADAARLGFASLKVLRNAAERSCFWDREQGILAGQTFENEVNNGVMNMDNQNTVADLEKQQTELVEQIAVAKTIKQRQRVAEIEKEISADNERLKQLRVDSAETDARNQPIIADFEAKIKTLKSESWETFMDGFELERAMQAKHREATELRNVIKEAA